MLIYGPFHYIYYNLETEVTQNVTIVDTLCDRCVKIDLIL